MSLLFRAAAATGRTIQEFQGIPRAERIGWLAYVEAEDLREQAREARGHELVVSALKALSKMMRRR